MSGLSVLVFSRDDASSVEALLEDLRGIADETVIIDSSGAPQHRRIERLAGPKVRVYHAVALGYPDPLRMYGLHKCRGRWVLLIDTDERLSQQLKDDIRDIIDAESADALAIRRSEPFAEGEATRLYTWQIRLFRRDRVEFTGLVHEQAMVRGRLGKLDSNIYTLQHLRGAGGKSPLEYSRMSMYERMSYSDYNVKVMDYMSKLSMGGDRSAESISAHIVRAAMLSYERLLGRQMEEEITHMDYLWYFTVRNIFYAIIRKESGRLLGSFSDARKELEAIRRAQLQDRSGEAFEISKRINRIGIIRYLGLDIDANVEALNRRYANSRQGIELLQRLLVERYRKTAKK
jgi:hypothetical protein